MNKEEILAKSRSEHDDEGLKNIENKGRRLGYIAFSCVFIFIIVFNLFCGKDNSIPFAMFWAYIAAESYPKYRFTQNGSFLFLTICGVITSGLSLLSYVQSVLG